MVAEGLATGGVVAVAIGAIELAKAVVAKRNGKKPDGNDAVLFHLKELRGETKDQTKMLGEVRDSIKELCIGMDRKQRN